MTEVKRLQPLSFEEFEALEQQEGYTYELIDDTAYIWPTPSIEHQRIRGRVYIAMLAALAGKEFEPIQSVDLILEKNNFVPDIMVLRDDDFNSDRQETPPLIVAEVLSPSSANRDHFIKRIKYEQLGIKEYWIVSPDDKCIMVISYATGSQRMYRDGVAKSIVIPELQIELVGIFEQT